VVRGVRAVILSLLNADGTEHAASANGRV
jgi:hypothetical protein